MLAPKAKTRGQAADLEYGPDNVGEGGKYPGPGGVPVLLHQHHIVAVIPESLLRYYIRTMTDSKWTGSRSTQSYFCPVIYGMNADNSSSCKL